jgi:predicted enzyme related to lactoylglutathione lyase
MHASAVLYVGALAPMRDFYAQCFGLEVADDTGEVCRLTSPAWELVLVTSPAAVPASSPPARRSATPVKLAFAVSSLAEARAAAARVGGSIADDETAFEYAGALRCDGTDPEGNVFQVLEARDGS